MKRIAFVFDLNRCVGCMACVAGCSVANGTGRENNWRAVHGFNRFRHPSLPVFHFSLACNHCESAPCLINCPALAYSRDETTGAVIHHSGKCIGCKYCTWACPYDAPKFNPADRVIGKCDLCVDRLAKGKEPACVSACPVGALGIEPDRQIVEPVAVPGFTDRGIGPSIRFIPLQNDSVRPEIWNSDEAPEPVAEAVSALPRPEKKITPGKDWTLVPFTLTIAFLAGWISASVTAGTVVSPYWFGAFAVAAAALSLLHLGRKERAWRSVLNIRNSWLSREILSFSLLVASGMVWLISGFTPAGVLAVISGLSCIVSADRVYRLTERRDSQPLHSSMVTITGLLVWSWFSQTGFLIAFFIALKAALYLFRKGQFSRMKIKTRPVFPAIRIMALILPALAFFVHPESTSWMFFLLLMAGEIMDRAEFYGEISVITPAEEMERAMTSSP